MTAPRAAGGSRRPRRPGGPEAGDIYLREGVARLHEDHGEAVARRTAMSATFVLAKPEAVVGRRLEALLAFLAARGFRVAATRTVRLDRHGVRNLWRRQLGAAPLAIARVTDLIAGAGPCVLVAVSDPDATSDRPAASRLSGSKGAAVPGGPPDTLRAALGASAPLLNFVHTPDGPPDVLRELAVLLDRQALREVLDRLATGAAEPVALVAHYAGTVAHELDPVVSLARLRAAGGEHPAIRAAAAALAAGADLAVDDRWPVVDGLADADVLPLWDRIVLMAHVIGDSRGGAGRSGDGPAPGGRAARDTGPANEAGGNEVTVATSWQSSRGAPEPAPFRESTDAIGDAGELRRRLSEDGYLLIRGCIAPPVVERVRERYSAALYDTGWTTRAGGLVPHEVAVPVTEDDLLPSYEAVLRIPSLHALAYDEGLLGVIEALFGERAFAHPCKFPRIMFPYTHVDVSETAAHQDFPYVQGTPDTLTAWIPLMACTSGRDGALEVLSGSHHGGLRPIHNAAGFKCAATSVDHADPAWRGGEYRPGDVLLFSSLTVHRARENRSDRIRVSVDCRFQPITAPICDDSLPPPYRPHVPDWPQLLPGDAQKLVRIPPHVPIQPRVKAKDAGSRFAAADFRWSGRLVAASPGRSL